LRSASRKRRSSTRRIRPLQKTETGSNDFLRVAVTGRRQARCKPSSHRRGQGPRPGDTVGAGATPLSTIVVRRRHDLGLAEAKRLAENIAKKLRNDYGGGCFLRGAEVQFQNNPGSASSGVGKGGG